jgi:DNA-binding NarL/FixJ family response regulator
MKKKKIRVLVVEDHPVVREGIRSVFEDSARLTVVGEAGTGAEALEKARKLLPDVMVVDIELPGMDGLEVTEMLRRELPSIRVILLSMHEGAGFIERATRSGACGYLLKQTPLQELVRAVVSMGSGGKDWDLETKGAAGMIAGARGVPKPCPSRLTKREEKILALIAVGKSNKEIAALLGMKKGTVSWSRVRVRQKLNIRTTAGMTKYAIANGLLSKLKSTVAGGTG